MDWRQSYKITPGPISTVEMIPASSVAQEPSFPLSPDALMLDTIHDGDLLPQAFWDVVVSKWKDNKEKLDEFDTTYTSERDWGADLVAHSIVEALNRRGVPCLGHHRVRIARVLMDFGRFPGNTSPDAEHLHRFAINYPFSFLLEYDQKKALLEAYYDDISAQYEAILPQKKFKFAIHTYDRFNKAGTERPLMSVITRSLSYQTKSSMPIDFFDPLYPAILSEYSADRRLVYRLSLMLEKAKLPVADNYPYHLPDGSLEVRAHVWFFFRYLRLRFEASSPKNRPPEASNLVWDMLLDTNLRSAESENLRSFLHMFRKPPKDQESLYREAKEIYNEIERFLHQNEMPLIHEYRASNKRPNIVGIEVRKDFVWDFADKGCRYPLGPKPENAQKVAEAFAEAIALYFHEDYDASDPEGSIS